MVIVITGPTAVGKTKLSVELAKKINGEIINADSTQIYKGLDIATAKIKEEEKEGIKHHLFDIKDIMEDYSVYDYQRDCRDTIDNILKKGKTPIIVGGTGLYIKSALYDYDFEFYKRKDYSNFTNDEIYNKVCLLDDNNKIHKNNRKRLELALSYMEDTNKKFSDKKINSKILYDTLFIGLTTSRDILYDRINKRVDIMFSDGLLDEAKSLYDSGIRTKAVMTPIGYKELFEYFDGKIGLDEAKDKIKQNSRRYAKRQYTWNKHQFDITHFTVDFDNFNNTVNEVLKFIGNNYDKE